MPLKFLHYVQRVHELGCKNFFLLTKNRITKKIFKFRFYKKRYQIQWQCVAKKLGVAQDFTIFFSNIKQKKIFETIFDTFNLFDEQRYDDTKICFGTINPESNNFKSGQLKWQKDFKACQLNKTHTILESQWQNQENIFYQDIKINSPQKMELNEYNPDIKIPWELSRFQHLVAIANMYKKNGNSKYTTIYTNQVTSWIENNPSFRGVNWVCPMDVAIRAINWIHAIHQFKNDKNISYEFWQKTISSLYEHAIFLENNWELSDRPNNHYLTDLLGYLYLCEFFSDSHKFEAAKQKTIKKMLQQFFHQVLPDGTTYEGSTSYHKLDLEIFLHLKIFCSIKDIVLPQEYYSRLEKMQQFIKNCTDSSGSLVQIGDNDSGKIAFNIFTNQSRDQVKDQDNNKLIKTYPNFGLTVIKSKNIHLTFRHATFTPSQPTGHFHQDELAITLSVENVQVLVDPGTYVYTANTKYRNLLRSYESHNTFYMNDIGTEQRMYNDIFQLNRTKSPIINSLCTSTTEPNGTKILFYGSYKIKSSVASRKIEIDTQVNEIKISDWDQNEKGNTWTWNLIFAPNITIDKVGTNLWRIKNNRKNLFSLESTINFEKIEWFYSVKYGTIEKCKKLTGQKKLSNSELTILRV